MDWSAFLSGLVGASFGSTLVGLLIKTWLDHRLTTERTKEQENRQILQKRREASAAIADILAEWVHSTYTGELSNEARWKLQTVYWKNILWLDKELLDALLPSLAGKPGAVNTNEIIVRARKVLLGLKEPDLSAEQLNNWLPQPKNVNLSETQEKQKANRLEL